jgi:hypothetical protein
MKNSQRIYRILLKAYPAGYLRKYEESMAQLFADQLRDADTLDKMVRLWIRTLADLARTLPARYAENFHGGVGNLQFADSGRKAIFFARYEASSFGRREITTEHLILGVLRENGELARILLGKDGQDNILREIEAMEPGARRLPEMKNLPVSESAKQVIQTAADEAARSGRPLDARGLLAAIIQQESSLAAQLLQRHGVDLSRLQ